MRICWASDVHLDFCREQVRDQFFARLTASPCEAIFLTGDIASNNRTDRLLTMMHAATHKQIFFTLGNHDFYGSSLRNVTSKVDALCARNPNLVRLDTACPVRLSSDVCLIGNGGWSCGTAGDGMDTPIAINDEFNIQDLRGLTKDRLFAKMRWLAQQSADLIYLTGKKAARDYPRVWIGTHVPPFAESCTYSGRPTERDYLPYFCNLLFGAMLRRLSAEFPSTKFTVMCGHTHGAAMYSPCPNLSIITATAEYGHPNICAELDPEKVPQL